MAIILNVGNSLIQSGSKVITYILISAYCLKTRDHCLLNLCKVLELSRQICRQWHDKKEVVETQEKEKPFGQIVGVLEKQETIRCGVHVGSQK